MKDVFISYKAEEFDEAKTIKQVLETNGISCWLAPNSIPGGSSYASEIPKAIRECKVFVVLISEQAQKSQWVPRELDQAVNNQKLIMPFMLENCPLKDDFNFYLSNVQRYAAYENKAEAMQRMVHEIKTVIAMQEGYTDTDNEATKASESISEQQEMSEENRHSGEENTKKEVKKHSKPKKESRQTAKPKQKGGEKKKSKKPLWITLAAVAALVVVIVLCSVFSKTTILGQKIKKDSISVTFESAQISQEDMQQILALKSLWIVNLKDCKIEPAALKSLIESDKIKNLKLDGCGLDNAALSNISFKASDIADLNLDNNALKSLDFLKPLSQTLKRLSVSGNQISSLAPLESFSLETLCADANALTSLEGLENSIELRELSASENKIAFLDGLSNATILEKVNLAHNAIGDISVLSKSAATLEQLYLADNSIGDLDALAGTTALETLSVERNQLVSLEPIVKNAQLKILSAAHNQITSVKGIASANLSYLDLAHNSLSGAFNLKHLKLHEQTLFVNAGFNDLTAVQLPDSGKLQLNIHGNPLEDFDVLKQENLIWAVTDYSAAVSYEEMPIQYSLYLYECPKDRRVALEQALSNVTFFESEAQIEDFLKQFIPADCAA